MTENGVDEESSAERSTILDRIIRQLPTLVVVGVTASLILVSIAGVGTGTMTDEWPDECGENTPVIEPGAYSGSLSPQDTDAFIIRGMEKGDYITIELAATTSVRIVGEPDVSYMTVNGSEYGDIPNYQRQAYDYLALSEGETQLRVYLESDDRLCLKILTQGGAAGDWMLSFDMHDTPPPVAGNQTVQELRAELEEKNDRVQELEQRVAELEQRSERENEATNEQNETGEVVGEETTTEPENRTASGTVTDVTAPENVAETFVDPTATSPGERISA